VLEWVKAENRVTHDERGLPLGWVLAGRPHRWAVDCAPVSVYA